MATKGTGKESGGNRPKRHRDALCSFCRKSNHDVGPFVEGPGEVYICAECVELCQDIIDQERSRRLGDYPLGYHRLLVNRICQLAGSVRVFLLEPQTAGTPLASCRPQVEQILRLADDVKGFFGKEPKSPPADVD